MLIILLTAFASRHIKSFPPQFADIAPIAHVVSVPVFAQHIDPVTPSR